MRQYWGKAIQLAYAALLNAHTSILELLVMKKIMFF